jgi:hypothetical protein
MQGGRFRKPATLREVVLAAHEIGVCLPLAHDSEPPAAHQHLRG